MPLFPSFTKTWHNTAYDDIDETKASLSAAGKVVLVTGGGKGIGKAIAISFARAGARAIVILGRTEATLLSAKSEIKKEAAQHTTLVRTFTADVLDAKAIGEVFSTVTSEIGRISILVNNAAYLSEHVLVAQSPLVDYWHGFEVNVKGSLIVTQAFLNCAAAHAATLINVTSGAAHIPYIPGYSGYAASKLALVKIMDYVQCENPLLDVFNLQPGLIESDMSRKSDLDMAEKDDICE
jgi:NAD(P)-dependent dehydrogenase (short-subunit alcohol dehydrogenase family)